MENEINPTIEEQSSNKELKPQEINTVSSNDSPKSCNKGAIFTKVNFIGNIVLFIVLITMFILHPSKSGETGSATFPGNGNMKIAFLNTDSIFNNYLMVKDLQEELNGKKSKLENEVMAKQQAFQTKLTNYQSNVQNNRITYDQAQTAEKKLMQERDDIVALGERYSNDIAALEFQIHQQISDSIINYTSRYNKTYNADYILGYTKGGGILVANPKYDVTVDIMKGLNEEYEKSKKTK